MAATGNLPVIGKDVVVSEGRPLPVQCVPVEVGLRRQTVEYTCVDASQQFLIVGSAQGYVWVVDLQSSRLLREFSEFKGAAAITVVKLNPVRDYIAYGTDHGFIRIERLSKVKFNKLRAQERSGQRVTCIEWDQKGEDIFCGFASGRVVHFNVKFKSDLMTHVPLNPEQYGSSVEQLSLSEKCLLISTIERSFILDICTNKLDQIGRKERKSGVYGGCFVEKGESLLVARPGLRIWIADKFGKVLSTLAFKEVLSTENLPSVVINSVPTSSIQFSRSWQFSTLHPMLGGKFVVSFHEKTLFVLDPINATAVGVATLQENIKSVVASGGFLYVLSNVLVRVAVHHAYVTMEYEPKRLLNSAFSTPCTSVGNSPMGSLENLNLTKEKYIKELQADSGCANELPSRRDDLPTGDDASTVVIGHDNIPEICMTSVPTVPLPGSREQGEDTVGPCLRSSQLELEHQDAVTTSPKSAAPEDEQLLVYHAFEDEPGKCDEQSNYPSICGDESPTLSRSVTSRLALKTDAPEKFSSMLSVPSSSKLPDKEPHSREENCDEGEGVDIVKEQARRFRMAQAAGNDIIAGSKSHRKRRKRSKGKKICSATSSATASMEKLADIVEEQVGEELSSEEQVDKQDVQPSVSSQQFTGNDQLEGFPGSRGDLVPSESSTFEPPPHTQVQELQVDAEQECMVLEDYIEDDVGGVPAGTISGDSASSTNVELGTGHGCMQLIDNESGQQFPSEVFESKLELIETVSSHDLGSETSSVTIAIANNLNDDSEDVTLSPCEATESEYATTAFVVEADDGNQPNFGKGKMEVLGEAVSDDPLYQDADEDHGNVLAMVQEVAPSKHCVLQPALSDPLQDEETLETGTLSDRPRHILIPSSFPAAEPTSFIRDISAKKAEHRETSWIDISEQDTYYSREQNFDASDSSHDSEAEVIITEASVTDSQVADDFYQLCGALVKTSDEQQQYPASENVFSQASVSDSNSLNQASRLCESQDGDSSEKVSEEQSMDIWMSMSLPSRHSLQWISVSDILIWAVDSRNQVFYTTTSSRGRTWQRNKKTMQQVSSSPSGHVVWGTYHQNAYVRLGIGMNAAGSMWKNVTKNTSLAHKIKQLAVEENGIWAIAVDNRVLFRKGVDEKNPEGKVWQEVSYGMNFSFIASCNGTTWALNHHGKAFVRDGITPSVPSGKKWLEIKSPSMMTVSITTEGVVWGINDEGSVGFRTGAVPSKPGGRGPWWEVVISSDSQALSPISSLWHAMGSDGGHRLSSAVSSLVSLPHQQQVTMVSASSKAGVVVLEGGHRLYGCWRMATGYHYTPACKEGIFQFNMWSHVAAGGTSLWFVRSDGDLYCLSPGSKLKRIEVPSTVELIAASPNCMWVISKDMVWSRQGMTADLPEGISFDYIELSTLLHDKKLRSVACGKKVAWGIDSSGVPHFRFGVHAREPGTGMSPAWVPVEDHPGPLLQIAVCPDDWMVWACDEEHNVYVRGGVTVDFPVGKNWVRIPKQKIKELAATSNRIYGLSPSGELMCRYGVSHNNVLGNFWRKMPGKYEHITTGMFGELWTLDSKGQVWKQEWKVIAVSDMHSDFDTNVLGNSEAWEFV